jgi:hypothetical protein
MLNDKERKLQAQALRALRARQHAKAQSHVVKSGNVPCYLNGMTEDKKADMGFYHCANTARISQLKADIKKERAKKITIVRVVK